MPEQLYRIKPLEWEGGDRASSVETPIGEYFVGRKAWTFYGNGRAGEPHDCISRKAGKAAAEAHYRARLSQMLEPVPAPEAADALAGAEAGDAKP